ncbi:MAG: hypothetical protein WD766_12250 [Gemmatimonadota bacterium]
MSYTGRATRTGNSKGFRFESALFTSHPEFASGDLEADVIAPGRLLVRTRTEGDEAERDAVLDAYLAFLREQISAHPEMLRLLTEADVAALDELLAGVEYDKADELDEGFELP